MDNNNKDISTSDFINKYKNDKCQSCSFKLSTYDWLERYKFPDQQNIPEIVEVRFKNTRKAFFNNPNKLRLEVGDAVVVDSPTGYDIGLASIVSDLVNIQMFKKEIEAGSEKVLNIQRLASLRDLENWKEARDLEHQTMIRARGFAKDLKLEMKINDVEYQADRKKATFYYTSDGRVDFRELIKVYAKNFRIKVEMRQIGIRQEAGRIGGIGDCGRELCCSSWLTNFTTVPTIAAKQQNLYLNPSKLSGQCGRLKCCLNYELDSYLEALESFPDESIILKSEKGDAKVFKIDILKGVMWFHYVKDDDTAPFPIKLKKIDKILKINSKGRKVSDFNEFTVKDEQKNKITDDPYAHL